MTNPIKDDVYSLGVTLYELITLMRDEEIVLDSREKRLYESYGDGSVQDRLSRVRRRVEETTGSEVFLEVLELMLENREENRPTLDELFEVFRLDELFERVLGEGEENQGSNNERREEMEMMEREQENFVFEQK